MSDVLSAPARPVSLLERWAGAVDLTDARFACLVAAIVLYAAAGSPTPDDPGVVEAAIGALLAFAAGAPAVTAAFRPRADEAAWRGVGSVLLLYGLTVPVLMGAFEGQDPRLIFRDLAPFLFLILPLFTADIFEKKPQHFWGLAWAYSGLGLMFSLRALGEVHATSVHIPWLHKTGELFYLANSPAVLFAAMWLTGESGRGFVREFNMPRLFGFAADALLALLPLVVMAFSLERAGIGAAVVYFAFLLFLGFMRAPYRVMVLFLMAGAVFFPLLPRMDHLFELLSRKNEVYGFNMRIEEAAAVWQEATKNWQVLLFGNGWGATFQSPAVAGVRVNYTHCLLTAMLFKTGLAGLALTMAYIAALGARLPGLIRGDVVLGLALAAPFLINVFLYASYKSLDFGLLLLLMAAV